MWRVEYRQDRHRHGTSNTTITFGRCPTPTGVTRSKKARVETLEAQQQLLQWKAPEMRGVPEAELADGELGGKPVKAAPHTALAFTTWGDARMWGVQEAKR